MATVKSSTVERYRKSLDDISGKAQPVIRQLLEALEWEDVTADATRAVLIMRVACESGTNLAAVSSANFYQHVRKLTLGGKYEALALSGFDPDATEGAVRYFVKAVTDGDKALFVDKCLSRYDYEIRLAARNCTKANARRDSADVKWMLVPEPGCCDYCQKLADLGFIENWSGDVEIHEHCRCSTVPGFEDRTQVEGFEEAPYELYADIPF